METPLVTTPSLSPRESATSANQPPASSGSGYGVDRIHEVNPFLPRVPKWGQ